MNGCKVYKDLNESEHKGNVGVASGYSFKVAGTKVVGAQATTIAAAAAQTQTAVAVTYTANDPSITADGALTVADGDAPTVAELLEFCEELKAQLVLAKADVLAVRTTLNSVLTALKTHGLIASA